MLLLWSFFLLWLVIRRKSFCGSLIVLTGSISDRRKLVEESKSLRSKDSCSNVSTSFTFFVCVLIVLSVVSGFFVGNQSALYGDGVFDSESENVSVVEVEGFEVVFLEKGVRQMTGDTIGYDKVSGNSRFFIRKDLSLPQIRETCNHELMHEYGIREYGHDFIKRNEEKLSSSICSKLVEKLQ